MPEHDNRQTPSLEITSRWIGRALVVSVSGDIDMLTAPTFADHIDSVLAFRPEALVLDLTSVDFLGAAGLAVVAQLRRPDRPHPVVAVAADGAATSRPIILTGISEIVPLHATVDAAIRSLAKSSD